MEERIVINGRELVITGLNAENLVQSSKFLRWLETFSADLNVGEINEVWSSWSQEGELIYALIRLYHIDETDRHRRRVIFFRSNAVTDFFVVKERETGRKIVVLIEQVRVPTGGKILEIPAGSVEDDGDFVGTMVREIWEEVGLVITAKDLGYLGTYYFSPGACNEKIALYYSEIELSRQEVQQLQDRLTGLRDHGENLKVKLVALDDFEKLEIRDAKTRLAYELYLRKKGRC